MKQHSFLMVLAGLVLIGAVTVAAENRGPEKLVLDGGTMGDVAVPHKLHQDKLNDCQACHDLFPQEKGVVDKLKADGTLKSKQIMNANCIACHRKYKKEKKKTGPVSCKQCHS